jgi:hypothetical protein
MSISDKLADLNATRVKVVLSERLCLQAGVDIALKGEDRLAGILRRKVSLSASPVS